MIRRIFAIEATAPKLKAIGAMGSLLAAMVFAVAVVRLLVATGVAGGMVDVISVENWASKVFLSVGWMVGAMLAELLAVPFLLGMRVSPLMRVVSMGAGWLVVIGWLVSLVAMGASGALPAVVFADTLAIPLDGLFVVLVVMLGVAMGWVTWGRWPERELNWKLMKNEQEKLGRAEKKKAKDPYEAVLEEAKRAVEAGKKQVEEEGKVAVKKPKKSAKKSAKKTK